MPIRKEHRYFYPIDWPQLSAWVRFARAKGCCEVCGRPHGQIVHHLGDGRWFDEQHETWRNGRGREVAWPATASIATSSRPAWCSPPPISTTTRATRGPATCARSASAAICSTTAPSTAGASEPPSSCAARLAICSSGFINDETPPAQAWTERDSENLTMGLEGRRVGKAAAGAGWWG